MHIYGLQKLTLLDYPGHTACTIFLGGCNYRCPFCHNYELTVNPENISPIPMEEFLTFLEKRQGLLDGVCVSGGEPTLHSGLPELLHNIKKSGMKVKLDTNGTNPAMLRSLLQEGLLDYIAMDIKAGLNNYSCATGVPADLAPIRASISLIMSCGIDYEFRTTIVEQIHSLNDFQQIGLLLKGARHYFLQTFTDRDTVPLKGLCAPTPEKLQQYLLEIQKYIPSAQIRGK